MIPALLPCVLSRPSLPPPSRPFADLEQQLFRALPPGRLGTHTFGHIVPPQNVLPLAVKAGPRGGALTFSFGSRGKLTLIDELGEALLRVAQTVPHGVVVFVPSFQYEAQLVARWQLSGLWARLNAVKPLFREPRAAAELEPLLKEYAATIRGDAADDGRSVGGTGGAMLLSVVSGAMPATTTAATATHPAALLVALPLALTPHPHARRGPRPQTPPLSTLARRLAPTHPTHPTQVGGKMSEGINFSDELARCVVMVGLPYANPTDLTLQERMAYVEGAQGAGAGREYYTNLCMKAVNQSIGRAIRHKGDYAAMLLLDGRYAKPDVRGRLPKWIGARMQAPPSFDAAISALRGFFATPR